MVVSILVSSGSAFFYLESYKWAPGINSAEEHDFNYLNPPMSPGGASWSAVPSGVGFGANLEGNLVLDDHPIGAVATDIEFLITPEVDGLEYSIFNAALNVWAEAAGISNLGQVVDSGADMGATETNGGHIGDIRVAALPFSGFIVDALARAFPPCTFDTCGSPDEMDGTLGGDIHFNTAYNWVDDPFESNAGNYDFFTVALHEIGHALGLHHTDVPGAVMNLAYVGARRELHQDDIDGIRALYGLPQIIPEPSSLMLAMLGGAVLVGRRRASCRR